MRTRSIRSASASMAAIAVAIALGGCIAGGDPDDAPVDAASQPPPAPVTEWSWFAHANATGPGVFRVTVDFGEENRCERRFEAAYEVSSGPSAWMSVEGGPWSMTGTSESVHVHAGDTVDTRSDASGRRAMRANGEGAMDGTRNITVVVKDMSGWHMGEDDPVHPAGIAISCEAPIAVLAFAGSREAFSVQDSQMAGGIGANVGGLTLNVDDHVRTEFGSPHVEVDIFDVTWVEYHDWTLTTPEASYGSQAALENMGHRYQGGPGPYEFRLTRVAPVQPFFGVTVWMAGYAPVAHLDDLIR